MQLTHVQLSTPAEDRRRQQQPASLSGPTTRGRTERELSTLRAAIQQRFVAEVASDRDMRPWDVRGAAMPWRLLRWLWSCLWRADEKYAWLRLRGLPAAWSFTRSVLAGTVSDEELPARRSACNECEYAAEMEQRCYCAAKIRSCGCPTKRWWPWSTLPRMQRKKTFVCPRGKFGAMK